MTHHTATDDLTWREIDDEIVALERSPFDVLGRQSGSGNALAQVSSPP